MDALMIEETSGSCDLPTMMAMSLRETCLPAGIAVELACKRWR
jgi:hypothetical protein